MTRMLHRLGTATAAHPWRTLALWVVALVTAFAVAGTVGGTPHDDYDVPGTRAQEGLDLLRAQFPTMAGATAQVVVTDPGQPIAPATLDALDKRLHAMPHVSNVSEPRLSADGDTALLLVQYDVPITDPDLMANIEPLETAVQPTRDSGVQVLLGGELPGTATEVKGHGEMVGLLVALIVLLLTFGSVVAAGVPLASALLGLAGASAGITVLAGVMDVSTSAPLVATMVGLGVGIDYALLLLTRHVEQLRKGFDPREAAAYATAASGRAVVFAGSTVLVSLMGLRLSGLQVYASFGFATAIAVLVMMATSLTVVPALAARAGTRLLPRKLRGLPVEERVAKSAEGRTLTGRWAEKVGRRPVVWGTLAVVALLALAAPALAMRTWPQDAGSQQAGTPVREAFDVVADEYGPGATTNVLLAVDLSQVPLGTLGTIRADVAAVPGVVGVGEPVVSPSGGAALMLVQPAYAASAEQTQPLLRDIRAVLPQGAELTGETPGLSDISEMLQDRIWLVIGFVVAVSFLLLLIVFRSVVVPLKAAAMNLLSIGAAYGVVTMVFQWGWGAGLFGLDHAVPVSSWLPILLFTILFGLSMDYEVFLLSRVREDYLATGDPHGSVVRGLSATGRVITAAAAIMIAVFAGFAVESDVIVSMIGVGLGAAIFIDATLVRLVLVPATMALLGHRNWWIPAWLDRLLPQLDVDGDLDALVAGSPAQPTATLTSA